LLCRKIAKSIVILFCLEYNYANYVYKYGFRVNIYIKYIEFQKFSLKEKATRKEFTMDKKKYLAEIDRVIKEGKFQDNWESLSNYKLADWYRNAKFGIFIHWGIYSVPAFANEWYSRNMYIQGSDEYEHHIKTYGKQKDFGYKDFIPMFKAEKFDAEQWAQLFEDSGARYVVPVAEHHDGFQMYKSEISHFNAYEMGPKRDVLGELKVALENH
jgi:alpha-L-fucosidase